MTLDFTEIARQLAELTRQMSATDDAPRFDALDNTFRGLRDDDLRLRLLSAKTSWLLAKTEADFRAVIPAPQLSGDFAVVASDGSFILPDRHSPARFYVINIGKVLLRYGQDPRAELNSAAHLYFREEELYVPTDVRRVPVNGTVLGLKRAADELAACAEQAAVQEEPTLALQDGTLILWGLESQPEAVVDWVLQPYLATMRRLRDTGIPVAAFISYPGSSDVMNSLRVSICDYPDHGMVVNCDHCRGRITTEQHVPACDILPDVTDRFVFEHVAELRPGERSQVFGSTSKILDRYDGDLRVHFFYLNTGSEIARVEIPRWVAANADLLGFTHAVIYDQCERGRGYPSALQEAHELAVIRGEDRRAVEAMVETSLARHGIMLRRSAKDWSKRGRFI